MRATVVGVVAMALIVAAALAGCGGVTGGSPEEPLSSEPAVASGSQAPSASGPSSPSTSASPVPTAAPTPSPAPTPALRKPTKKDPLRVYFGGDSLAGMPGVMLQRLGQKNGLAKVRPDYVVSSRLTYPDPIDWPARVGAQVGATRTDVGVFMIGANDTGMPMLAGGESTMYPKKTWLAEYERRAKKIATIMLRHGAERVYWVGMPIMPSSSESKKMRALNELFANVAASSPDVVYVDSYDLLSKKNGDFNASLRSGDGVHYTDEGAEVVAEAVWQAIKADWRTP